MNWKRGIVFICIGVWISFFTNPIRAATPTPTPPSIVLPGGAIQIPNSVINQTIKSSSDAQENAEPTPKYEGGVDALNPNMTNFKIPKLEGIASWLTQTTRFMGAKQIQDKVKEHSDNLYISGQAQRCISIPALNIQYNQVGQVYKTSLVGYIPDLITSTEQLTMYTARNSESLVGGVYNLDGPSYEVNPTPPPCDIEGLGTTQNPTEVPMAQGFNLGDWIQQALQKFTVSSTLASKQQFPEGERISCLFNQCTTKNVDLAYIGNPKEEEKTKNSGGIADGFRQIFMDTTKGEPPNGQQQNFTGTNNYETKQMENAADLIKCSLLPPQQQAKMGLTGKCGGFVTASAPSEDCEEMLKNMTFDPAKYSGFGTSNDATLGFSIPMHNTGCKISNISAVADFAAQWINGRPEANTARANVLKYYETIETYAIKAGWNPAFLVALWIEETAAGGLPGAQMGCVYDFGKSGTADPSVCGQIACLANYVPRNSTYDFLCSYGGAANASGSKIGCTTFYINAANDNRCFPSNIRGSYQEVVNRGGVGAGCAPTGATSELFRKDCESKVPGGSIFDK